jgi:CubicO group peptidase (beta-lactamase class C family)
MSTNDTTHGTPSGTAAAKAIAGDTPDPAVVDYLRGAPPPQAGIVDDDVTTAIGLVEQAARVATFQDGTGNRWVPGLSIVLVRREGGECRAQYYGYGTKHVDRDAPIGPDTLFPCASLSKPVSASLLVNAARRRKSELKWESPVRKVGGTEQDFYHLRNSPAKETTLRQWLSHLSGLPDHAGDLIEDMNPEMTRHDLIDRILNYQTGIELGKSHYTNMGFTIGCFGAAYGLGGAEWDAFAQDELKALGMSRSTYSFVPVYRDSSDRVFPHQGQPEASELRSLAQTGWTWHVTSEADERNPRRQAPAGSLLSSAKDLGTFLAAHLNGAFGSDFPSRNPTADEGQYSLGWNVTNHSSDPAFKNARNAVSFNHSGAFRQGAGTFLRFDPDMGIGIAILSNGEPTGVPEALAQLFFKTLYRQPMPPGCHYAKLFATMRSAYMGMMYDQKIRNYDAYHAKPRAPIPDRIPQGEVFRGHSDYFGCDFVVERRKPTSPSDSGLFVNMGNGRDGKPFWSLPLECIDDNPSASTFVYETKGENEVGLSPLRFVWNGNVVVQIVDAWLNEQGKDLGTINRSR